MRLILKSALPDSWMAHSPNCNNCISTLLFKKKFIGVELIYNVLISAAQQNESVILINTKHSLLTQTSKRLAIHFINITIIVLRELKRERTKKTRQELFGKSLRNSEMRDLVTQYGKVNEFPIAVLTSTHNSRRKWTEMRSLAN